MVFLRGHSPRTHEDVPGHLWVRCAGPPKPASRTRPRQIRTVASDDKDVLECLGRRVRSTKHEALATEDSGAATDPAGLGGFRGRPELGLTEMVKSWLSS